jgi:hypothetical protein
LIARRGALRVIDQFGDEVLAVGRENPARVPLDATQK